MSIGNSIAGAAKQALPDINDLARANTQSPLYQVQADLIAKGLLA